MNGLDHDYSEQIEFRSIDATSQDGKAAYQAYSLRGHPSYVLLNPEGEVLWSGIGEQTVTVLEEQMRLVLGAQSDQAISDYASLVERLQSSGTSVERGGEISQPFFKPEGQVIKVNGEDVQVFEYRSEEEADLEAEQVSPDGSAIGSNMISWIDTPHFYRSGKIIVLYIGQTFQITDILSQVLGPRFAGG